MDQPAAVFFQILTLVIATGPIVKTPLGVIEGFWGQSYGNRTFSNFYAVPYAQPPVGSLRFREPQPPLPWEGRWIANVTTMCTMILRGQYVGDENCLHMNIFVPSKDPAHMKKNLPVFFHIPAGAFMFGYGLSYSGPVYMMDRDVILISVNYRVGALGFMSTEDEVVPGNNGLKDQVAALQWVNKNIAYFGGDPNQITITGLSAGGASVHYHYLSPMSRGLYKNGISVSGTALEPWSFQEAALQKARVLGNACGCNQEETEDMVRCLRMRPAKQIVEETKANFDIWLGNPFSPFAPVIEKSPGNTFLSEHPYKLLSEGKVNDVPWIATVTADEGLYPSAEFLNNLDYLPYIENNWFKLCPSLFDFNYTLPLNEHQQASTCIKDFYMNGEPISNSTFKMLSKALTERLFALGVEKAVKLQAKVNTAPVYMYRYNYTAEKQLSFASIYSTAPKQGVCHGDDMMIIFSQFHRNKPFFLMTPNDQKMQNILLDFWMSFSKTGKPSSNDIKWKKVEKKKEINYLHVNSPSSIKCRLYHRLQTTNSGRHLAS